MIIFMVDNMTYWNGNGKYENENKIIRDKYVPSEGVRLTADTSANRAIIAYLRMAHKYHRFYNDGDAFSGLHSVRVIENGRNVKEYPYDEFNERVAEEKMDKAILRVWKATYGATLPVVDELEDRHDYDVYEGRGRVSYKKYTIRRNGRSGRTKFYKILLDS